MVDDSALIHGRVYDPLKAREYYLRTRKLKGRKRGAPDSKPASSGKTSTNGSKSVAKVPKRQAELEAQKKALKEKVERLHAILEKAVEEAKKRSGGDPNQSRSRKGSKAQRSVTKESPEQTAKRNRSEKGDSPLTTSQKREKAKKAKEAYEKEHPNTLSQDVAILREQVKDLQLRIQKARDGSRGTRTKAGTTKAGVVQPNRNKKSSDGPNGR